MFLRHAAFHLSLLLSTIVLSSCATRYAPYSDHASSFRESPRVRKYQPPVILFLVDGLSVQALRDGIAAGSTPNLRRFFLKGKTGFLLGRATFPSLTYPNIASVLTGETVDRHGVVGNKILYGNREISFESIQSRDTLNQLIRNKSYFSKLGRENRDSLSLAHFFYAGTTVKLSDDIRTGLAYLNEDFRYIDGKSIGALEHLLKNTEARYLPDFTFVHLIGFDAIAHVHGDRSPRARAYLAELDRLLGGAFEQLERYEEESSHSGDRVVTLLTADHGFQELHRIAYIEDTIRSFARDPNDRVQVINQGRLAGMHFPLSWGESRRVELFRRLVLNRNVDYLVSRENNRITVRSRSLSATLTYLARSCVETEYAIGVSFNRSPMIAHCPEVWDQIHAHSLPAYFISNLARYFRSAHAPDAVILAADHVAFYPGMLANHGGFSPEEMLVPILERNSPLKGGNGPIETRQILRFLTDPSEPVVATVPSFPAPELSHVKKSRIAEKSGDDDDDANTEIGQSIDISTPMSRSFLSSTRLFDRSRRELQSPLTPIVRLTYSQAWTQFFSTHLGYRYEYLNYSSPEVEQDSYALHQFNLGARYRFGGSHNLFLTFSKGEDFFTRSFSPQSQALTQVWIPELSFGTRSRIYSTGLGDLGVMGSLSVLFQGSNDDVEAYTGFKQTVGAFFSRPVATADLLQFVAQADRLDQSTAIEDRSKFSFQLGVSYSLSFQR